MDARQAHTSINMNRKREWVIYEAKTQGKWAVYFHDIEFIEESKSIKTIL